MAKREVQSKPVCINNDVKSISKGGSIVYGESVDSAEHDQCTVQAC